jgi:hypothetical protein
MNGRIEDCQLERWSRPLQVEAGRKPADASPDDRYAHC